jgi:nitrogen regulatory protein P-II 1
MKLIVAYIQPFMVDKLSRALLKAPIGGYTLLEGKGFGHANEESTDYHEPRVRVEIAVTDDNVDEVTQIISTSVGRHRDQDGLILVLDVLAAVSIKTGKRNEEALI